MRVARLGRVADRSPLAVAFPSCTDAAFHDAEVPVKHLEAGDALDAQRSSPEQQLRVVIKIRPRQLHYLVGSHLACVVRSHSPITAMAPVQPSCINDAVESSLPTPRVLVTTVDGDIWLVTLASPDQRPLRGGVVSQLWLQRPPLSLTASSAGLSSLSAEITPTQFPSLQTSQTGSRQAKWLFQVSGSVGIEHVQLQQAAVAVVRSVLAPTTVVVHQWTAPNSTEDDMELDSVSIELDELEGDQSTCSWAGHGSNKRFAGLLTSLFPEDANRVQDMLFVLQGDTDGCVRFAVVPVPQDIDRSAPLELGRAGKLVASIGEPIAAIIPLSATTTAPLTSRGEHLPSCNALLICGANGRLAVFSPAVTGSSSSRPVRPQDWCYQRLQLDSGLTLQSIAAVHSLSLLVYCVQGSVFICSCAELVPVRGRQRDGSVASVDTRSRKLPFPADVVRFAVDSSEDSVSIVSASGRVVSMEMATFSAVAESVLPTKSTPTPQEQAADGLPRRDVSTLQPGPSVNGGDEARLRFLLDQIAQVSDRSAGERAQSLALDKYLEALHSALEVQRLVRTKGIDSVILCSIRASRAACGTFATRITVALTCSVKLGKHSSAIQSLENWMVRVRLQTPHEDDGVATYTFPLQSSPGGSVGGDTSLVLDPGAVRLDNIAALTVACELVFRAPVNTSPASSSSSNDQDEDEGAFTLAIPIGAPRQLLLVQLGEPVNEHTSTSTASPARRSAEPSRYASRYASSDEKSTGHSVVRWWSALGSHAERDEYFAGIWSKITRVAAEQNQEDGRVSLTKLTSPSRFSMTIPSILPVTERSQPDGNRVEHMLQLLARLLPAVETATLRRNCRVVQGSKLWLTLRTLAGNLLLLKLQPLGKAGALSVVVQCSDSSELSAMRALLADVIVEVEAQAPRDPHVVNRACGRLSVALGSHMDAIVGLEALVQELMEKVAASLEDADDSSACTDEIVHAFAQLSSIEAQVLDIYWRTRRSFDKVNL